jgi:hypothetical protein
VERGSGEREGEVLQPGLTIFPRSVAEHFFVGLTVAGSIPEELQLRNLALEGNGSGYAAKNPNSGGQPGMERGIHASKPPHCP